MEETREPLKGLVQGWMSKIRLAQKFKKELFQNDADTAMKFFTCGKELNDLLWVERLKNRPIDDDDEHLPAPRFRILVGKVAELVQLFGPSLYHRNPTIVVEPKNPDIPIDLLMSLVPPEVMQQAQMQAQMTGQQFDPRSLFPPDPDEAPNRVIALLLQHYLDYMQRENDKKTHSRRMIEEALIKGAGVLWTETYHPYNEGPKLVGSFYDTIDNLLIDPDAETLDDAKWIARRCLHPIWEVADKYHLEDDFLRSKYASYESAHVQGETSGNRDASNGRPSGKTNDLMEYWQVYSKMGMGHKLAGIKGVDELYDLLDSFGDNSYIVVAEKVPYPLNFTSDMLDDAMTAPKEEQDETQEAAFMACQWPIPFWADGTWPMTMLAFHEVPNQVWPMSHIKPGLGHLEFITWCMSFLVNRVRTSCRTVVSAMKALEDEVRGKLFDGKDFVVLDIEKSLVPDGDVKKAVHFMEMPQANLDLWKILEAEFDLFDKATGLSELMYAAQGGMRSAREASIKQGAMSIRPDDMANQVEDTMSLIARKEAMAARWLLDGQSVAPVLGKRCAALWEQYVMSGDIEAVAREFHYRVEAGSSRKPNKETRIDQINQALQQWNPLLTLCLQNPMLWGTVNAFLTTWGEANDVEVKPYLLPPPPPPQPDPNQQKIMAEIEKGKAELGFKQEELKLKAAESQQKMEFEREKIAMQLQGQQAKTQADVMKAQTDMNIQQAKARQDMEVAQFEAAGKVRAQQMDMQVNAMKAKQEMVQGAQQHRQAMEVGAREHMQGMVQGAAESKARIQQQKQAAKAKPKSGDKK